MGADARNRGLARSRLGLVILAVLGLTTACADAPTAEKYDYRDVAQSREANRGLIVSARKVELTHLHASPDVKDIGAGGAVGGASGAVGGSYVGGSLRAKLLAMIAGGATGVAAGEKAEGLIAAQNAYEYVIEIETPIAVQDRRYSDGSQRSQTEAEGEKLVSVVQADDKPFAVGDRVIVIGGKAPKVIADTGRRETPEALRARTDPRGLGNSSEVRPGPEGRLRLDRND